MAMTHNNNSSSRSSRRRRSRRRRHNCYCYDRIPIMILLLALTLLFVPPTESLSVGRNSIINKNNNNVYKNKNLFPPSRSSSKVVGVVGWTHQQTTKTTTATTTLRSQWYDSSDGNDNNFNYNNCNNNNNNAFPSMMNELTNMGMNNNNNNPNNNNFNNNTSTMSTTTTMSSSSNGSLNNNNNNMNNNMNTVMSTADCPGYIPTNGVVADQIDTTMEYWTGMQTQLQQQQQQQQEQHQTWDYLSTGSSSSSSSSSSTNGVVSRTTTTTTTSSSSTTKTPDGEKRGGGPSIHPGTVGAAAAQTAPEVNHWTSIMKGGLFFQKKKKVETVDMVYKDLRDMSKYDLEQVEGYWEKLLPVVSYLGTERVVKVYDALRVAYRAHRGQVRKSGEPFIIHPVEVALLLAGLKMDGPTIMAGLLHDTVEDTDLTFELIEDMFGMTVRSIVEGETKVSKLPKLAFSDYADEQAENLRQMFVAMTDDYRIIIVKLADRLHNMRTLRHMKPEKQIKISRETLDIFAPLAHRMGIWQFKSELEDTAFMYLYPQEYNRLSRRLRQHQQRFQDTLDNSQELLRARLHSDPTLRDQAASVKVFGRMKEIYSLWHKMETKGERNLDHIVDVVALRVVITPKSNPERDDVDENDSDRGVWLCYHVLGLVQHLDGFQPVPTRVKDYISFPKPNGYQSLHTALILNGQKIEVQIRTSMMHQVAEYGMASHWAYTDSKRGGKDDLYNTPWLSSIKEWHYEKLDARDFVDSVRNELLGKRVFVFLRNGKILNLARGATAIDAAFQIHTEVGLNMHGVEINGKPVPISYELQNGDVVSILTGEGRPSTDWMRYAKSRSTRSKLRSYFRAQQKESLWEAGKILLMDYLWMHGPLIEKSSYIDGDFIVPTTVEELAPLLPGNTQYDDIDDLLITIGKQPDRALLHTFVSKMFKVPQKLLVNAEKNRASLVPNSVLDAVYDRRRIAKDAAEAAASAQSATFSYSAEQEGQVATPAADKAWPTPMAATSASVSSQSIERTTPSLVNGTVEYADPEHLCQYCLPVYGDEIVGTRSERDSKETTPRVHRLGCPIAQRALNRALSENQRPTGGGVDPLNSSSSTPRVDNVSLRWKVNSRYQGPTTSEVPVKLQWAEFAGDDVLTHTFPCEIIVHAQDRKLLLADCSELVSELSEIMKTGSQTTNEHATLVFLIRIHCLDDLQKVMNSLQQVRSVMAVERRFGSELLGVSIPP